MNLKIITFCILGLLLSFQAFAQNGTIRGQVIEDDTGEPLIGATVLIEGTTNGTATDLDGKFSLSVAAGTYTLQISFVSFETQKITGVEVKANEVTVINNVRLGSGGGMDLEEIVVEAKTMKNSESALLTMQKKASVVLDGISSEQFSRIGDSDAASAVKRVTGVSVEGGKYVYVRGLGDRYSKTSVNGADIPGLDPNRNTVQMDLFPSNLLDNIMVYKTFSPDLPGDFSGGLVRLETKDFPETFTLQVSGSVGYNPQVHLQDGFLGFETGNTDWLGLAGNSRDVPDVVANNNIPTTAQANADPTLGSLLQQQSQAFDTDFNYTEENKFLDRNFSFSVGNQYTLFGRPFGFVAGLSYNHSFESYTAEEGGEANIWTLQGLGESRLLGELRINNDNQSKESVLLGGLVNLSYKITDNSKISFNYLRNQGIDKQARFQTGTKAGDDATLGYRTIGLQLQERTMNMFQMKGVHNVAAWNNFKIDWISSATTSSMEEPDLRFFTWGNNPGNGQIGITPSTGQVPTRYYRDMTELNWDNRLNFELPFTQWNGQSSKLKFGAAYTIKDREFREDQFRYDRNTAGLLPTGDETAPQDFFGSTWTANDPNNVNQTFISSFFIAANNYDANQAITAGYLMTELPLNKKLKAIVGLRFERTDLRFTSFDNIQIDAGEEIDDFTGPAIIPAEEEITLLDNNDFLPSINLVYQVKENMNIRGGYSRTLARPTFRELAPFTSFDFIGGYLLVGNPLLERTTIDNFDLRWEMYPKSGEIISLSAFYKRFQNPIEQVINVEQGATDLLELTYRNLPDSELLGLELEIRKQLDFITEGLRFFTLGANFTYVYSRVNIPNDQLAFIQALNIDNNEETRPMFGQSPYVVNTFINFRNESGWQSNLAFNVNGPRIAVVDLAGNNVIERPRPSLNFNVSKQIGRFSVKVAANNLLDPEYKYVQEYRGTDYIFQNSRAGRRFSVGVKYLID